MVNSTIASDGDSITVWKDIATKVSLHATKTQIWDSSKLPQFSWTFLDMKMVHELKFQLPWSGIFTNAIIKEKEGNKGCKRECHVEKKTKKV